MGYEVLEPASFLEQRNRFNPDQPSAIGSLSRESVIS
jgi:hypothetical protein